MSGFEYPGNNKHEEKEASGARERKLPDFVFVDKEEEYGGEPFGRFEEQFSRSAKMMKRQQFPIAIRVVCLFCALFLFFFSAIGLFFVTLFFFLNVITFFQGKAFWAQTKKVWGHLKKTLVTAMGLTIAVFSPPFGLAIIMVYFLLLGQSMDDQWAGRILKRRFYR